MIKQEVSINEQRTAFGSNEERKKAAEHDNKIGWENTSFLLGVWFRGFGQWSLRLVEVDIRYQYYHEEGLCLKTFSCSFVLSSLAATLCGKSA